MMTIVVGYLPAKGGRASLDLAAVLARSGSAEPVAVVTVVPQHWATPSLAKVDAEFAAWAHQQGEAALETGRNVLPGAGALGTATGRLTLGRLAATHAGLGRLRTGSRAQVVDLDRH